VLLTNSTFMTETQTHNPDAEQRAFNAFAETHPKNDKKTWRRPRGRRGMRETLRGPGGRHETSTRPGERFRDAREMAGETLRSARKLGELGVGMVLYGSAVLRAKRNYEQAQREQRAVEAYRRQEREEVELAREYQANRNLWTAASQVNDSRVRPQATLYTSQAAIEARRAAELPPTPAPAQETFNGVVDHAQALEQPHPDVADVQHDVDLPAVPEYTLQDTIGTDDSDLPLFQESLTAHEARHAAPEDDSDLPIFQDTKRAMDYLPKHGATQAPAYQPGTGIRNHRTPVNTHNR
jgi:hypothetical protein